MPPEKTSPCLSLLLALCTLCLMTSAASGQSRWKRHTIDDSLRGADGVRLADANGDGRPDIVTGWEESGQTRAYFHPGPESVSDVWPHVSVGESPAVEDAVWVDLNGDGQLDVLSSCEGGEQSLRLHAAPGSPDRLLEKNAWHTRVLPISRRRTRWMFALPVPSLIDASPSPTVVLGSKAPNGMVALLTAPGPPENAWEIEPLTDATWIMSLEAVDVDGDQDLDVVYSNRKGETSGVFWLENPSGPAGGANGAWKRHLIGGAGREIMFLQVHAASPDSRLEIYAGVKPNVVYRFTRPDDAGEVWQVQTIRVTPEDRVGTAKGIAVADLDLDGTDEIVLSCEQANAPKSGVYYLKQLGSNGDWTFHDVSGPQGIKFDLIELIDLDEDGDLDILTCEEREQGRGLGVIWYANPNG